MNPYKDTRVSDICIIREFDTNVSNDELVWHRDEVKRTVIVMEGKGWSFQRDNELPISIGKGTVIDIEKNEFHRLRKGETKLKLKILEFPNEVALLKTINRQRTSILEF
tara:strand:- start:118 stop:444 length:327 start_codon:yes stop_codon:yes gene_type:complete